MLLSITKRIFVTLSSRVSLLSTQCGSDNLYLYEVYFLRTVIDSELLQNSCIVLAIRYIVVIDIIVIIASAYAVVYCKYDEGSLYFSNGIYFQCVLCYTSATML